MTNGETIVWMGAGHLGHERRPNVWIEGYYIGWGQGTTDNMGARIRASSCVWIDIQTEWT